MLTKHASSRELTQSLVSHCRQGGVLLKGIDIRTSQSVKAPISHVWRCVAACRSHGTAACDSDKDWRECPQ
jgi:hypothetical protein